MASNFSRIFKDISLSFSKNPLTNDIITLYNEDAVKKSVMNLVRTKLGERFFRPLIGTSLNNTVFELNIYETSDSLSNEIQTLLENFEPRIVVQDIQVQGDEESYELNVEISYKIVGLPLPEQTIDFILQPSRL